MPFEDPDDEQRFEPPLPPEDRLWRHPSELGGDAPPPGPRIEVVLRPGRARLALVALIGLIVGVGGTAAAFVALGSSESPPQHTATQVVADILTRDDGKSELTIASEALPAIARVDATSNGSRTSATAIVLRDDGYLLTTSDAIDGAEEIVVTLDDDTVHEASMVGRDRRADVAVLHIDATGLPVAAMPDRPAREVIGFGDHVVLVDAAVPGSAAPRITRGVVSEASRQLDSDRRATMFGMIQVDTEQRRGAHSAGAVMLDSSGAAIGIVTARGLGEVGDLDITTADGTAGAELSRRSSRFATPFDHSRTVFERVLTEGSFTYPLLDLDGRQLRDNEAERRDLPAGSGLLIENVPHGSPAARAGLAGRDVIVELAGEPVCDMNDLLTALRRHQPGDTVAITYRRGGQTRVTDATLDADPGVR